MPKISLIRNKKTEKERMQKNCGDVEKKRNYSPRVWWKPFISTQSGISAQLTKFALQIAYVKTICLCLATIFSNKNVSIAMTHAWGQSVNNLQCGLTPAWIFSELSKLSSFVYHENIFLLPSLQLLCPWLLLQGCHFVWCSPGTKRCLI